MVIGAPFGIASANISLMFFISSEIITMFSKTIRKKKISTKILLYWLEAN